MNQTVSFQYQQQEIRFFLPSPDDHIQRHIGTKHCFYEAEMLERIAHRVPRGGLVVDVGANIGNHTIYFAKVMGARTISCEPNPRALEILRRNVDINTAGQQVELHAVAIGQGDARGEVQDIDQRNLGRARVVASASGAVTIRPLDQVVGDRQVDLIKIDVEGMEPQVLQGALTVIRRSLPLLIIEAGTPEALSHIDAILAPLGYCKTHVFNHTPTYLFEPPARVQPEQPRQIVAGMATVAGNEAALRAAVASLLPQVDRLHVYLNGFHQVPRFLAGNPRIVPTLDPQGTRYGDAGKFAGVRHSPRAIYLTCDDDFIYPPGYAQHMAACLDRLARPAVVGLHGSLLRQPFSSYHAADGRTVLHFQDFQLQARAVHLLGTGTCAFRTDEVDIDLPDFAAPNMADVWFAKFLQARHIPRYTVPHPRHWLKPLEVRRPSIYEDSRKRTGSFYDNTAVHDEAIRSMLPLSIADSLHGQHAPLVEVLHADGPPDAPARRPPMPEGARERITIVICPTQALHPSWSQALQACGHETHVISASQARSAYYAGLIARAAPEGSAQPADRAEAALAP